jgi:hypothetical protein
MEKFEIAINLAKFSLPRLIPPHGSDIIGRIASARVSWRSILSPSAIVLRIIILVVAFCVLIAVFAFMLKLVFLVASLVGIAICGLAAFLIFRKLFFTASDSAAAERETTIRSLDGTVPLFNEMPNVHQLVDKSMSNLPRNVIEIPGEQEVLVLEERDIALRIKIQTGEHKGRVGWVDRSHVINHSQKS